MILVYLGGVLTGVGLSAVALVVALVLGDESDEVGAWRGEQFGFDCTKGSLPKGYRPVSSERAELIRGNGRRAS